MGIGFAYIAIRRVEMLTRYIKAYESFCACPKGPADHCNLCNGTGVFWIVEIPKGQGVAVIATTREDHILCELE